MKTEEIHKKSEIMSKLQAFSLFREKGMKAVESMFPEHKDFVDKNREKSLREIKNELIVAAQKTIKNKSQYEAALATAYALMQHDLKPGSKESGELERLSILIKKYEEEHHPVPK